MGLLQGFLGHTCEYTKGANHQNQLRQPHRAWTLWLLSWIGKPLTTLHWAPFSTGQESFEHVTYGAGFWFGSASCIPTFHLATLCSSHRSREHLMLLLQGMMLCSPNPLGSSLPSTHAHLLFEAHWQILLLCIVVPLSAEDERLASASQPQSPGSSFVPWALAFTQLWSPLYSHCGSQGRPYLKDALWTEECPCVLNLGGPFPLNVNKPFTSVKTLWNVYGFSFLENGLA